MRSSLLKIGACWSKGFFDAHSQLVKGARCTVYPGSDEGVTGTIALVTLSYIEYLRASPDLASDRRSLFETRVGEYLQDVGQERAPEWALVRRLRPQELQTAR